jgi:hypothetical protein
MDTVCTINSEHHEASKQPVKPGAIQHNSSHFSMLASPLADSSPTLWRRLAAGAPIFFVTHRPFPGTYRLI